MDEMERVVKGAIKCLFYDKAHIYLLVHFALVASFPVPSALRQLQFILECLMVYRRRLAYSKLSGTRLRDINDVRLLCTMD